MMWFSLWRRYTERRKSAPAEREEWERRRREESLREREDIARRLKYLEAEMQVWARKDL